MLHALEASSQNRRSVTSVGCEIIQEMEKYTKDNPLKVFTTFSGYDSQLMALRRAGIPFECIGWSEIDKYAIQAHNAVFPEYADRNFGDITKIDWANVPDFDFLTYSSPCQDFSQCGLQRGARRFGYPVFTPMGGQKSHPRQEAAVLAHGECQGTCEQEILADIQIVAGLVVGARVCESSVRAQRFGLWRSPKS